MIYRKPSYYDTFHCIAGQCPESCCIGWQIMIDEDSLAAYAKMETPFGAVLKNSIDWEEGCFMHYNRRCAFLNEENLCDIQTELSEDDLCYTCKTYPRHTEEFDGVREYSLSLSCPEAARIMLDATAPAAFLTEETDESEWDEDFEDFDDLLFDQLISTREHLFAIATDRSISLERRLDMLLFYAEKLQWCLDEGQIFEMEDAFYETAPLRSYTLSEAAADFSLLYELEFLHEDQKERLDRGWAFLKANPDASWQSACLTTDADVIAAEQLLMFFLYTYYLGSVYDDRIYSKVAMSVFSVRAILILYQSMLPADATDAEKHGLLIRASYEYAREVEHSDLNLNLLEDRLEEAWQ